MTQHYHAPRRSLPARTWLIIAFFAALVALILFNFWGGQAITSANPQNPRAVALGREVYAARCASCHGANLEGAPNWQTPLPAGGMPAPPHDPSGHTWHHNDESLFATVK